MFTYNDLETFLQGKDYKMIIAADAEPFVHTTKQGTISTTLPEGGVGIAFDALARSSRATFIARGRTSEDKQVVEGKGKITDPTGKYTLKRLFFAEKDLDSYYSGYSNQTLWPLCHIAYQRPLFSNSWFEGYQKVNETFAKAIKEDIKGKTFIWLNDYQLSLVPQYLGRQKNTMIGFFWHIPWPTWEIFRILPQKKQILQSLLSCDYIAFHRGYQARNFLQCVELELEARIDLETSKVYYNKNVTTVSNLPLGIDTDAIRSLVQPMEKPSKLTTIMQKILPPKQPKNPIEKALQEGKLLLGVDRLDYTKGLISRLQAIDLFFTKNPSYKGKVAYVELIAPSREQIPAYNELKKRLTELSKEINAKHKKGTWVPVVIERGMYPRTEIVKFFTQADVCLVTPLDDGMNLVSKEFVIATEANPEPGMLVLSQFAGSAIDLTDAVIVNPYNTEEVAEAIKKALEMPLKEKKRRLDNMVPTLDERNLYEWARTFIKNTEQAAKENRLTA